MLPDVPWQINEASDLIASETSWTCGEERSRMTPCLLLITYLAYCSLHNLYLAHLALLLHFFLRYLVPLLLLLPPPHLRYHPYPLFSLSSALPPNPLVLKRVKQQQKMPHPF